jgi:hypothetical protein
MKKKMLFGLGLLAAIFSGCVLQSIHPLFEEKDYIRYPALAGTWTQKDGDKELGLWVFEPADKRFKLTQTDEKGRKAVFVVAAGKIGTNTFLDFFPDLDEGDQLPGHHLNDFIAAEMIPAHVFVKLVKTNEALTLIAVDMEWLAKNLEQNPKSIAHIVQDKRPIFTASTDELQKWVAKYADDEKVFKNDIQLIRKKTAQ